jgi:hypothetical protein
MTLGFSLVALLAFAGWWESSALSPQSPRLANGVQSGPGAAGVAGPPRAWWAELLGAMQYGYVLPGRGSAVLWRWTETGANEVERLSAFATVEVLGPAADPAYNQVRTAGGHLGLVEAARLGAGDGGAAERRWCEDGAGLPPVNNEIASRRQSGPHRITIINLGDRWAVVKLRDGGRRTILSVFVGPQSTAEVRNVPSGRFRIEFALGKRWSRRCGMFLDGMQAQRFPDSDAQLAIGS